MKRSVLIFLAGVSILPNAFAFEVSRSDSLLARVTVYWARGGHGTDQYTRQHKSATGLRLHQGHCAVDPRKIPYGSKVVLPDGTALSAVDTGSAVRNRKAARKSGHSLNERSAIVIDKFFETKTQALTWANSNPPFVNVRVIPPNAPPPTKPSIATTRPIALAPALASGSVLSSSSAPQNTIASSATVGSATRNPLGRLGR
jgi:3D (Asp-Asp-Asp) domain-containing protein